MKSARAKVLHELGGLPLITYVCRTAQSLGPEKIYVLVGHQAETIVRFAEQHHCDEVVLDNPPKGLLAVLGLGSIGSQVRHLMHVHATQSAAAGPSPEISGSA